MHVRVPPLRERREDIPLLIRRFLEKFRVSGEEVTLTDEARACLMAHDYPGNVRELETVIRRAVLFAREGKIGVEALPSAVTKLPGEVLRVPVRVPTTAAQLLAAKRIPRGKPPPTSSALSCSRRSPPPTAAPARLRARRE